MTQAQAIAARRGALAKLTNARQSLPDNRDEDCDYHATCLSCPLPACRYDHPKGLRGVLDLQRNNESRSQRCEGLSLGDVASQLVVSKRTVFRASPKLYAWLERKARRCGYGGGGAHGTDHDGAAHRVLADVWMAEDDA